MTESVRVVKVEVAGEAGRSGNPVIDGVVSGGQPAASGVLVFREVEEVLEKRSCKIGNGD